MSKVTFEISMSLDGYITGPNVGPDNPLGDGGPGLHEWAANERDVALVYESAKATGAIIAGRRAYDHSWPQWGLGKAPEGDTPIFVVSHGRHEEALQVDGSPFVFVNDGIDSALASARDAAGDKQVSIMGGANLFMQYLNAGHVNEITIHLVPLLLGGGVRLFDNLDVKLPELKRTQVVDYSPHVTHIKYAVN